MIRTPLPVLHPLFADHAVLQRDRSVPIWGWTEPGTEITVTLGEDTVPTVADAAGRWEASMPPRPAGGPLILTVSGPCIAIRHVDLWRGELWLASGQSNMQFPLADDTDRATALVDADVPELRFFLVPADAGPEARAYTPGTWQPSTPGTAGGFSAVAWYAAREMARRLGVAVGVIQSCWGGTSISAWSSPDVLDAMPDQAGPRAWLSGEIARWQAMDRDAVAYQAAWWQTWDPGSRGVIPRHADPALDDRGWDIVPGRPGPGTPVGVVWYRRWVSIIGDWEGSDLILDLPWIEDEDTTWWNGRQIGSSTELWGHRHYRIPGAQVPAGRQLIAIRLRTSRPDSGFQSTGILALRGPRGDAIDLSHGWRCQAGPLQVEYGRAPPHFGSPFLPGVLFHGMIAPLQPMALRGVLWYQGEADTHRAEVYARHLAAMIRAWGQGFRSDLATGIVQLAGWDPQPAPEKRDHWALFREAQAAAVGLIPLAGLAPAIDVGDVADIHPRRKAPVGLRLARWALARVHGQAVPAHGPRLERWTVDGVTATLTFHSPGGALVSLGKGLRGFALAGEDRRFVAAQGEIKDDIVRLSAPGVERPVAVRYAFADAPEATLGDAIGNAAEPFRTDRWLVPDPWATPSVG